MTYLDTHIFKAEIQNIFRDEWHYICHINQLKNDGDCLSLALLDEPILIINHQGSYRAYYNVCQHRGALLVDPGTTSVSSGIKCPYHGWQYETDGRLKAGIGSEQLKACGYRLELKPIPLEIRFGFLFINLSEQPKKMNSIFDLYHSDLMPLGLEEFQCLGSPFEIPILSNWKHLVENNLEGLHIAFSHSGLYQLYEDRYPIEIHGLSTKTDIPLSKPKRGFSESLYFNILSDTDDKKIWSYYTSFPNLTLEVYPEQVVLFQYIPLSVNLTLLKGAYYAHPKNDSRELKALQRLNYRIGKKTLIEDIKICEDLQKTCASKAFPERRWIQPQESVLEVFHKEVETRLKKKSAGQTYPML